VFVCVLAPSRNLQRIAACAPPPQQKLTATAALEAGQSEFHPSSSWDALRLRFANGHVPSNEQLRPHLLLGCCQQLKIIVFR
jgi:hypothetical protein